MFVSSTHHAVQATPPPEPSVANPTSGGDSSSPDHTLAPGRQQRLGSTLSQRQPLEPQAGPISSPGPTGRPSQRPQAVGVPSAVSDGTRSPNPDHEHTLRRVSKNGTSACATGPGQTRDLASIISPDAGSSSSGERDKSRQEAFTLCNPFPCQNLLFSASPITADRTGAAHGNPIIPYQRCLDPVKVYLLPEILPHSRRGLRPKNRCNTAPGHLLPHLAQKSFGSGPYSVWNARVSGR